MSTSTSTRERYVSKADFARSIPTSPRQVQRALKRGLPVTPSGRIPLHRATRWWLDHETQRAKQPAPETEAGPVTRLYSASRSQKMAFDARRAEAAAAREELELAVRRGELVEIIEVRRHAFDAHRVVRNRYLSIADRVVPRLKGETDPARMRAIVIEEVQLVLEALQEDMTHPAFQERLRQQKSGG